MVRGSGRDGLAFASLGVFVVSLVWAWKATEGMGTATRIVAFSTTGALYLMWGYGALILAGVALAVPCILIYTLWKNISKN